MKFLLPALLLASSVAASTKTKRSHSDILRARQYHPRDNTDVCGNIDSVLNVTMSGDDVRNVGNLAECLCVSAIPDFLESNSVALAAVALVGDTTVTNDLSNLIHAAADSAHCVYPSHATPACSTENPCAFTCPSGYTPSPAAPATPTTCKCSGPACPSSSASASAAAARKKRDVNWWMDAESQCPSAASSACGVPGSPRSWECVNTMTDIESCGGCTLPLHPSAPRGTDCTEIPGIASVACVEGGCAVKSCRPGWLVAPSGDSCIEDESADRESTYDRILHAFQYGLEHVPLRH